MTKRLSVGVLLVAVFIFMTSMAAFAERPIARPWVDKGNAYNLLANPDLPMIFRASAGTTWVQVYADDNSACSPEDTANSTHGLDFVWCFEGAGGDSLWTYGPNGIGPEGTSQDHWGHWAKFNPPIPQASKWHISTRTFGSAPGQADSLGTYVAWAGCDAFGENPNCDDTAFWVNDNGYGDDWNFPLTLDASGQPADLGGTIEFDVRYDVECDYDYLYLEYLEPGGDWSLVTDVSDGTGAEAIFNAVSGNPDNFNLDCGDDYFGFGDEDSTGEKVHGTSEWIWNVQFPIPDGLTSGLTIRWRAFSDGAWSDADGRGDTDGIGAIDNVTVTIENGANDILIEDDFESNSFSGITTTNGVGPDASWTPGGLDGNTLDGWHLENDPKYTNKGNTCTFSDDWMWTSKPAGGFQENGFSFFLTTPVIPCDGWTGAVCERSQYLCQRSERRDFINTHVRTYNSAAGSWSNWNDFDGYITFSGCDFWNMNSTDDATAFLNANTDSLQFAFEQLDISAPGDFEWGRHGAVTFLVDNVSIGSFDGNATVFTVRSIDLFSDTFSLADPAHTPQMVNSEEGLWEGLSGQVRPFEQGDSLLVQVNDTQGITAGNVTLHWRHDDATGPREDTQTYGSWEPAITLDFRLPDPVSTSDEGTYAAIIGKDDGSNEDVDGVNDNGKIWKEGVTVQYYIKVQDNMGNFAVFPDGADDLVDPTYLEFSVLPFGLTNEFGESILLVDDYTRNAFDYQRSADFDATGGAGFGTFLDPTFDQPEDMIERALGLMYNAAGADPGGQSCLGQVRRPGSRLERAARASRNLFRDAEPRRVHGQLR